MLANIAETAQSTQMLANIAETGQST